MGEKSATRRERTGTLIGGRLERQNSLVEKEGLITEGGMRFQKTNARKMGNSVSPRFCSASGRGDKNSEEEKSSNKRQFLTGGQRA